MQARPVKPVRVSDRGAARWTRGHPWIFRSDLMDEVEGAGPFSIPLKDIAKANLEFEFS